MVVSMEVLDYLFIELWYCAVGIQIYTIPRSALQIRTVDMIVLNLDILSEVVDHIKLFPRRERKEILSHLSTTCRELSEAVRPILFHDLRWPHRNLSKIKSSKDLLFSPETVWNHIR